MGDLAARAALSAGSDATAAWAALPEHERARAALTAGRLDLPGVIARAIAAARSVEPKSALVAELEKAHAARDVRALMQLVPRAHAALTAGKVSRIATWATDAALLAANGEAEDATFAALEALREAHEASAPGAAARWGDVSIIDRPFDAYAVAELVTEDLPAEHGGGRLVGYRLLDASADTETALRAARVLVGDADDQTRAACAGSALDAVIGSFGDVRFVARPAFQHPACWSRWIVAELHGDALRWRALPGAPGSTGGERRAFHDAVEIALERVAESSDAWRAAWRAATKALDQRYLIGLGNNPDAEGWRLAISGDPVALERRFALARR